MQASALLPLDHNENSKNESLATKNNQAEGDFFHHSLFQHFIEVLVYLIFIFGVSAFIYEFLYQDGNPFKWTPPVIAQIIAYLFTFFPLFSYRVFGLCRTTFNLLLGGATLLLIVHTFFAQATFSVLLFWFLLIPIMAHFFLPSGLALIWSLISILYVSIFAMAKIHFLPVTKENIALPLTLLLLLLVVTLLSIFFKKMFLQHTKLIEEKNYQIKSFLQIIGHDLATPLFIINTHAETALKKMQKQGEDDVENKEYKKWTAIYRASDSMKDILNVVLDMQALEMGKIKANIVKTDISQVIEMSILNFSERLKHKQVEINFENKIPNNCFAKVDPLIFENQIMNNVISNAIKFSNPNDQIFIMAKELDDELIIQVNDNGVGIPKDILYNIFRWDKKTSRRGTSGESGTGFGMPLVRKFIDLFQGKIEIESRFIEDFPEKHGTTISIYIQKIKE